MTDGADPVAHGPEAAPFTPRLAAAATRLSEQFTLAVAADASPWQRALLLVGFTREGLQIAVWGANGSTIWPLAPRLLEADTLTAALARVIDVHEAAEGSGWNLLAIRVAGGPLLPGSFYSTVRALTAAALRAANLDDPGWIAPLFTTATVGTA